MQNKAIEVMKEKIVEALSQDDNRCRQEQIHTNCVGCGQKNIETYNNKKNDSLQDNCNYELTLQDNCNDERTLQDNCIDEISKQDTCMVDTAEEETEILSASELNKKNQNFGKFKNPDELMRAYQELEKEFTRRSQKLSKIENEMNEAKAPYVPSDDEWRVTVDKFFESTPTARPFAKDIARELIRDPNLKNDANCLPFALTRVLVEKFQTPEQMLKDGQFLNDYVLQSESVKALVIDNYLKGLKNGLSPATLSSCGEVSVLAMSKPKSLEEAGIMFLKNNK